MEKYLIIMLIIIFIYTLYVCFQINEPFAGTAGITETSNVDETNAINILAKLAQDLQEGAGLKVKGNLLVDRDMSISGNTNITGTTTLTGATTLTGTTTINNTLNTKDINITGTTTSIGNTNIAGALLVDKGVLTATTGANITGLTNITGSTNIKGPTNITGAIYSTEPMNVPVIVLNQKVGQPGVAVNWENAVFTEQMVKFFKLSEPDGMKRDFLIVHHAYMDMNHPMVFIRYASAIKLGNQILAFAHAPEHQNIARTDRGGASTDHNWRRVITNP